MKIEYYCYYPVMRKNKFYPKGDRKYLSIEHIRKKLPDYITRELINDTPQRSCNCICVETKKKNVLDYLDQIMNIKRNNFTRSRYIEISEDEIENYDYFYVDFRNLDWGLHVNYDFSEPNCKKEACPWGARITSEVRIKSRSIRSLDIGRIWGIWNLDIMFVVSQKLKNKFVSHGVTGLKYKPCLIERTTGKKGEAKVFEGGFYIAQIMSSVTQYASDIFLNDYCREHSIIINYEICNLITPRKRLLKSDFQMVDRVEIKRKVYRYRIPHFFISRKVLTILLENKVADLRQTGIYLTRSFVPVPFDNCTSYKYRGNKKKSCTNSLVKQST